MNKILKFENENKVLKEQNKNIQVKLAELKKSFTKAQRLSEKFRQNYKILQQEEDLLVKLQSTKKEFIKNETELAGMTPRKKRKITGENIDNHNINSKSHLVHEGLLVIRYLFLTIFL